MSAFGPLAAIVLSLVCGGCGGGQAGSVAAVTEVNYTERMVEFQVALPVDTVGHGYTAQLYLSTVSGFTPSTTNLQSPVGGGATVNNLQYFCFTGLTPNTEYYVVPVFSDDAGQTEIRPEQSFHTLPARPGRVDALIGDSISLGIGGGNLTGQLASALVSAGAARSACVLNLGQAATSTNDWIPNGACIVRAENTINAAQATVAHIMLGTNDAVYGISSTTYRANLAATAADLFAKCGSLQVIRLHEPPYRNQEAVNQAALGTDYPAALSALDNGSTLRRGATGVYAHGTALLKQSLDAYHGEYPDDIHPNTAGAKFIAARMAASEQ